jgi:hypothetical protein
MDCVTARSVGNPHRQSAYRAIDRVDPIANQLEICIPDFSLVIANIDCGKPPSRATNGMNLIRVPRKMPKNAALA